MVLMDEMNLARIEYYFSEFLSRLENRPGPGISDESMLRPSRIEIDVPIADGQSVSIYPGHNTLFVGTMNEDESTQSLSDKVLDRGNAIRFSRPENFVDKVETPDVAPNDEYLLFETWDSWYQHELSEEKKAALKLLVETLESALEKLDRPFGLRIYHAIAAYAANHPDADKDGALEMAVADMMELRVLPKLRGIEVDRPQQEGINELISFAQDDLGDHELASKIRISNGADGMFTWKG